MGPSRLGDKISKFLGLMSLHKLSWIPTIHPEKKLIVILFGLCNMDIYDIRKQLLYTSGDLFARRAFNFIYFTTCKKTSDIHCLSTADK